MSDQTTHCGVSNYLINLSGCKEAISQRFNPDERVHAYQRPDAPPVLEMEPEAHLWLKEGSYYFTNFSRGKWAGEVKAGTAQSVSVPVLGGKKNA